MEQLIIGVFEQGFIYAIMALGVYITYKNIRLSGSVRRQYFPIRSSSDNRHALLRKEPTACINCSNSSRSNCRNGHRNHHVKFKVRDLLSGIIVMTGLYTLNLRIVGGSANVPLFNYKSVFDNDFINGIFPEVLAPYKTVIIIFIIMIIAKNIIRLIFKNKIRIPLKSRWR